MDLQAASNNAILHPSYGSPTLSKHPFPSSSCQIPSLQPFRPVFLFHNAQFRSLHRPILIAAEATSGRGNDLDDIAARLIERASDAARFVSLKTGQFFRSAGQKAVEFEKDLNLQEKLLRALGVANLKLEEFGYDARKRAAKWDRKFRISQKAQHLADFASETVRNVDEQFAIGQKVRNASLDLGRNWPTYNRRFNQFRQTPFGKTLSTLFFVWLLLSGWLFRIIFLSTWILPLALPFIINTVARSAVIEGACPSCKRRFIGNRSQVIVCNYCRAVVWQPRQDFSKEDSDPSIIDIDVDYR